MTLRQFHACIAVCGGALRFGARLFDIGLDAGFCHARLARRQLGPDGSLQIRIRSLGFVDSRRLDEHFEKHGAEFGHITKQDYLRQAQLLRDAKVGGPVWRPTRSILRP